MSEKSDTSSDTSDCEDCIMINKVNDALEEKFNNLQSQIDRLEYDNELMKDIIKTMMKLLNNNENVLEEFLHSDMSFLIKNEKDVGRSTFYCPKKLFFEKFEEYCKNNNKNIGVMATEKYYNVVFQEYGMLCFKETLSYPKDSSPYEDVFFHRFDLKKVD
jgi:hypothetical protein